jgi:hypothetical protein
LTRDFFDPTPEEQKVRLIDSATLRKAEKLIESCEHCNPGDAEIPFDNILDRVTGSDPSVTDYVLETLPLASVRCDKSLACKLRPKVDVAGQQTKYSFGVVRVTLRG